MSKYPNFESMPFPSFTEERKENHQDEPSVRTMEQIDIKPIYTKEDIKEFSYLNHVAGIAPFFRGPYPSMYKARPWTVRQYAGFSTAEESNAFYRRNLA